MLGVYGWFVVGLDGLWVVSSFTANDFLCGIGSRSFSLPNWPSSYDLMNPRMVDSEMSYFFAAGRLQCQLSYDRHDLHI